MIHRDLKPSNILVCLYDGRPVPKVIDFGLAKAMHQSLTEHTIYTAHGLMVGTPLYMSPEQAEFNNLDIDTRSDIYSLGVILYELLTGTTPLEKRQFKDAAWQEMVRLIKEEEAVKPSLKLSTSASLPSVAAQRSVEPAQLSRAVRGDLDWIVMKALDKERSRRYETATGLARDIERYLKDEPVEACPPSTAYRLRKFARKNRSLLATAGILATVLLVGATVSTWQALRATQAERLAENRLVEMTDERNRANTERDRAVDAEKLAADRLSVVEQQKLEIGKERDRANQERQISQAVRTFLERDLLSQASPNQQADRLRELEDASFEALANPSIRELLDRTAVELAPDRIEQRFPGQPLLQAEILTVIGRAYHGAGEYVKAVSQLERAYNLCAAQRGNDHPETIRGLESLGNAYSFSGEANKALSLLEQTVQWRRVHQGEDHLDTLRSTNSLAIAYQSAGQWNKSLPLYQQVLQRRKDKLADNHPDVMESMHNLAVGYRLTSQMDKALELFEETLKRRRAELGEDHPNTLLSMYCVALMYRDLGQLDKAIPLFEHNLARRRAKMGDDNPYTLSSMSNLAAAYRSAGQPNKALPLDEEFAQRQRTKLGPDHPGTLASMNTLALRYLGVKKFDLALPLFEEILNARRAKLGPDHIDTLTSMNYLAWGYKVAGKFDLALPLFEETLKLKQAKLGPDHASTVVTMTDFASAYQAAGKLDLALRLREEAFKLQQATLGLDHPDTHTALSKLAWAVEHTRDFPRAASLFAELWEARKKSLPSDNRSRIDTENHLGWMLSLAGRFAEAEPHLVNSYNDGLNAKGFPAEWLQIYVSRLFWLYTELDRPADVEKWRATWRAQGGKPGPLVVSIATELLAHENYVAAEKMMRAWPNESKVDAEHWSQFNAKSLLGACLLGQKKYAEAEPLLVAGYEGMREREATMLHPEAKVKMNQALDRLIQFAQETNRPDDLQKWQHEKATRSRDAQPASP